MAKYTLGWQYSLEWPKHRTCKSLRWLSANGVAWNTNTNQVTTSLRLFPAMFGLGTTWCLPGADERCSASRGRCRRVVNLACLSPRDLTELIYKDFAGKHGPIITKFSFKEPNYLAVNLLNLRFVYCTSTLRDTQRFWFINISRPIFFLCVCDLCTNKINLIVKLRVR